VSASPVIETDALTKRYGRVRGIEDVSLAVEAGEVFGFLGPNGAGKTTTIRTLLDLLRPSPRHLHASSGSIAAATESPSTPGSMRLRRVSRAVASRSTATRASRAAAFCS
jgi:ABC-type multidrug transport system ATPase subunit